MCVHGASFKNPPRVDAPMTQIVDVMGSEGTLEQVLADMGRVMENIQAFLDGMGRGVRLREDLLDLAPNRDVAGLSFGMMELMGLSWSLARDLGEPRDPGLRDMPAEELCLGIVLRDRQIDVLAEIGDSIMRSLGTIASVIDAETADPLYDAKDYVDRSVNMMIGQVNGMIDELAGRDGFDPELPPGSTDGGVSLREALRYMGAEDRRRVLCQEMGLRYRCQ